jgi:hypothetical protein
MKTFPILSWSIRNLPDSPKSVPWSFMEGHAEQAMENHSQTLERLAERGGLSPLEMYLVVSNKSWSERDFETNEAALSWLIGALAAHVSLNKAFTDGK